MKTFATTGSYEVSHLLKYPLIKNINGIRIRKKIVIMQLPDIQMIFMIKQKIFNSKKCH